MSDLMGTRSGNTESPPLRCINCNVPMCNANRNTHVFRGLKAPFVERTGKGPQVYNCRLCYLGDCCYFRQQLCYYDVLLSANHERVEGVENQRAQHRQAGDGHFEEEEMCTCILEAYRGLANANHFVGLRAFISSCDTFLNNTDRQHTRRVTCLYSSLRSSRGSRRLVLSATNLKWSLRHHETAPRRQGPPRKKLCLGVQTHGSNNLHSKRYAEFESRV